MRASTGRLFADLPVLFAKADVGLLPERWSTVGERHSILSSKFSSLRPPLVGIFHRCGKGNTRIGRPTIAAPFEPTESQEDPSGVARRHPDVIARCKDP